MQYVLTESEYDSMANKKDFDELQKELGRVNEELNMAKNYFKSGGTCERHALNGYCNSCPISSMHMKKGFRICNDERYFK